MVYETYGDWQYQPEVFVLPEDQSKENDYENLLKEKEELIQNFSEQMKNQQPSTTITKAERAKRAFSAVEMMKLSEKESRYLIDDQLRKFVIYMRKWAIREQTKRKSFKIL